MNAPAYFCKTMAKALQGIENLRIYIDDILAFADDVEGMIKTLRQFFQRAREKLFYLSPKKTEILRTKVVFAGHEISEQGTRNNPEKTRALLKIDEPKNAGELMGFLASSNWLRGRIPNYSKIASELRDLLQFKIKGTSRKKKVAERIPLAPHWRPRHTLAFENMKQALADSVVLAHSSVPDDHALVIYTDSSVASGAL